MYSKWKTNPASVHASWDAYFSNVEGGAAPGDAFVAPPPVSGPPAPSRQVAAPAAAAQPSSSGPAPNPGDRSYHIAIQTQNIIRAYQVFGHRHAKIDPLGIKQQPYVRELDIKTYGITEAELDVTVPIIDPAHLKSGLLAPNEGGHLTLREIIQRLRSAYCGSIGVEFMHMQDREKSDWIRHRFEVRNIIPSAEDRKNVFIRLAWATKFEQFLATKFTDKRFGCDGAEVIIPALKVLIDEAADRGVENVTIGMAHRGRLNVLTNVLRKPMASVFHEFQKGTHYKKGVISGDVKYHLGTSYDRPTRSGKMVHLSIMANPSHLEAVNPFVEGKTFSVLQMNNDKEKKTAMSLLVHGDASYAGQGVVYESITLSGLPKYSTGGTVHVILNNQIGFTTNPEDSRPGEYCTDVSKTTMTPIFHVNGDDPDAVCWTMKLAAEWRQTFHTDFVADIVAYRRMGHNEVDQPHFTQPLMYQIIEKHPSTLDLYEKKLLADGVITKDEVDFIYAEVQKGLEEGFAASKDFVFRESDWLSSRWQGFKGPEQLARIKTTGVAPHLLQTIGKVISTVPEGFTLHPVIKRMLQARQKSLASGEPLDWATAEHLAFGTLLTEGFGVRLTGQDVERGTFSHRHAIVHDQKTGENYKFLDHIPEVLRNARFQIYNSFLSEYAAMGFEVGYTLHDPNTLVMWEAQFGDFSNGAQIVIDQFISSGEQKWMRQSGIVLLLPHGYEGMGPEHSSARLERFLQMSDQDPDVIPDQNETTRMTIQKANWQIVICTTPANYFHVLRRQMHREFRKPLIIFTPKSLLRHPLVKSPQSAFDDVDEDGDSKFIRVYHEVDQDLVAPAKVKRLVLCTGKVFWDLYEERQKRNIKNIALVRVEQLVPFPFDEVMRELQRYPNADVRWVQEEPKNMGAWSFVYFNLRTSLRELKDNRELHFIGRPVSASPAVGSSKKHKEEQDQIINEAFAL